MLLKRDGCEILCYSRGEKKSLQFVTQRLEMYIV